MLLEFFEVLAGLQDKGHGLLHFHDGAHMRARLPAAICSHKKTCRASPQSWHQPTRGNTVKR